MIEICVESASDLVRAQRGGAGRVELCAALREGGLTPSRAAIERAIERSEGMPVMVLIRCRRGGFVYHEDEIAVMAEDARFAFEQGATGVVFGALDRGGHIDVEAARRMTAGIPSRCATFHRAFDAVPGPWEPELDRLLELSIGRVLTSGQAPSALEGRDAVAAMHVHAGGDIVVMAGGGVRPPNIPELLRTTGIKELHLSAHRRVVDPLPAATARIAAATDLEANVHHVTDEELVRAAVEAARPFGV